MDLINILILIPLLPLIGSIIAGLFGKQVGRAGSHWVTILAVGGSCLLSLYVIKLLVMDGQGPVNTSIYTWAVVDGIRFEVGFLVDRLTALMMGVVTFVSLMVHIYTIGYMHEDPGYQRFFSYINLFTFSMLMLVMANNFMQLFFGWEAVGLVSYLLIGFWYKRQSAIAANLKAFLVNRVGDFGFLLGIAAIVSTFGTLDYSGVFTLAPSFQDATIDIPGIGEWSLITFICIGLFIGAMGKSAQAPLHVWLPDSMEGPTPISALIHAATMVTAGIFMVARMSPLFEMSETALSFVLVIGAVTAFTMGLIGLVQNDIKRVVAYSTLSQLGYMTVALGASAYAAAIFHLMTHAFFKALLFLGAGSVIIAMHHRQDMREMGGLKKYMPVTYWTAWVGTLALIGFPLFSGFYSKDMIIEAVGHSHRAGATFAYWCVLLGAFFTALYSFRLLHLTFHGKPRMDEHTRSHLHESPWVVTVPLVLLAIPSVLIGYFTIEPLLFGDFFGNAIQVRPENNVLAELAEHFHGPMAMALHALVTPVFWLVIGGAVLGSFIYLRKPKLADWFVERFHWAHQLLVRKYWFDELYQNVFARGGIGLGRGLWRRADAGLIDGLLVNGSANFTGRMAGLFRYLQSGYLYHYAFMMIVGLIIIVGAFVVFVQ
ncbi:MAG: NADH-quinone oxidoreductase subunit L [Wenzhouxiangellaceae bacterium]